MDTKKIVSLEKHMDSVDIYVNHFSDDSIEPVCPKYSESGNHGCDGIFEAKKIYEKGKRLLQTTYKHYKE